MEGFVDEADLALLEVAQAAVGQLRLFDEVPEAKSSRSTRAVRRPRTRRRAPCRRR
ncbi:MAG: hypothetical protein R2711_16410 [Acidimicrobiales bacterium]